MASKSIPAKKKSTTPTDDAKEASITTILKRTCKSLNGTTTLTYHVCLDETSAIHWKIHSNTGNGMLSQAWVKFTDIQQALDKWSKDHTIVSMALYSLYSGRSVNTPSFLLASLVNEGIVEPVQGKQRHYQLGDSKPFLNAVEEWKAKHTAPDKAKPTAKVKAVTRMTKGKAKTATGK